MKIGEAIDIQVTLIHARKQLRIAVRKSKEFRVPKDTGDTIKAALFNTDNALGKLRTYINTLNKIKMEATDKDKAAYQKEYGNK